MSTAATAPAADTGAAPPAKGRKKRILIAAAILMVLAVSAAAAALLLRPRADEFGDAQDGPAAAPVHAKALDPKHAPTYVPLDPFTVNLADKDTERYAQVAVTLELGDPAVADAIKAYMPAVRNNILMVLARKTAAEMTAHDGKLRLASEIRRETARGLGVEPGAEGAAGSAQPGRDSTEPPPVTNVYFSTFIVQ